MRTTLLAARYALAVAVATWWALSGCSSEPPVAGGTETGNPDVTACVTIAFDALAEGSAWDVRSYVPGGMERLDSLGILAGSAYRPAEGSLAKRWVERSDTVNNGVRYVTYTVHIDDTVLVRRTVFVTDTLFVNDTLVRVDTLRDTAYAVEGRDTTRIIRLRTDIDSVFVVDTVYHCYTLLSVDTLFVKDTIIVHDTVSLDITSWADTQFVIPSESLNVRYVPDATVSLPPADSVKVDYTRRDGANYVVQPVSSGGAVLVYMVPVPPQNYFVLNEIATALISKTLVTDRGAVIAEAFGDADGDGALFGPGRQVIRYAYGYALNRDSLFAAVDFDAGADGSFRTSADNTIRTLVRRTQTARRLENVYYARDTFVSDSLTLETFETFGDSSLEWFSGRFVLRRGAGLTRPNDDSLIVWRASAIYKSGDVRRIDLTARMDTPVRAGTRPISAILEATVWKADGGVGVLNARLDFAATMAHGTYRIDGVTHDIAVDRYGRPLQ